MLLYVQSKRYSSEKTMTADKVAKKQRKGVCIMKKIYVLFAEENFLVFVVNNRVYMTTHFFESYDVDAYADLRMNREDAAELVKNEFKKHDTEENSTFKYMLDELYTEINSDRFDIFFKSYMDIDEFEESLNTNESLHLVYEE